MCIVYGLNYLDKTSISYASVMGIQKDIGLINDDYQWLGSMFYFGYIAWEYPTTRLLQRLPLAKYSSFCVIMWGVTLACFAGVTNFAGAVAVRFFLGVFEAAVTPGFALLTSQWYTKAEQGSRTGIWFSFNGFAQIFGGLVAYGIAKGTEAHPAAIEGWKIVFLLTGLLTAVIGVIFFFTVPDNQLNARWLSKEDRILAIERIRINQQGVGNKHFKWYQLREALADPLTWAFVFYALVADIPNGMLLTASLPVSSFTNILRRRHQQFLQPAHQILRLHITAIPALRHARWCRRDCGAHRMRVCRRLLQEPHSGQHVWARHRHSRHVSHRWPATRQRQRPSCRVLPNPGIAHTIRRFPVFDQQ
jgi:MFS family permease